MKEKTALRDNRFRRICRFYVLEETRIHGKDYLLVTDAPEDEDGECYILKGCIR